MLPKKGRTAAAAVQVEDSFVLYRKSTCRIALVLPDQALQEIEAARAAKALLVVIAAEYVGSYLDPMRTALFSFS